MRLLFLFLLLVNGLIYQWYNLNQTPLNVATASIESSAPKLILLSELTPEAKPEPVAVKESVIPTIDDKPDKPIKSCYTLGPFMNNDDVTAATKELLHTGRPFSKRVSEMKEQIGYWVYLPPFESWEAAKAKAEEFKLLGDKHYYVIKNVPADYANAISLGVFGARENAERRYRQLKNLGYDVKLEGRYRQNPIFWLDYTEQSDSPAFKVGDFIGAQRLPRGC